ncbi:hypothetical protein IJV79_04540, partial [bacterium]|nr:hypothetical protein [bacterium]
MKKYFIGLTLAPSSIVDSGVVVVDRNNEIIFMDKLYTMNDVRFFFENFASLKDSQVCVSIPQDNTLINGKWRLLSKHYQMVNSNDRILNTDNWTERFSHRGSDLFLELKEKGISINRYGIYLTRQALGLVSHIKDRSPGDCKFLQTMLKTRFGFENLPSNM